MPFLFPEGIHKLLCHNHIVCTSPTRDEGYLGGKNKNWNFGDNFVDGVTQTDRPKVADCFRPRLFRYESNESFVKVLRNFFCSKYTFDFKLHRLPHNHLEPLKEPSMEAIGSRSFKGFHGVKCK